MRLHVGKSCTKQGFSPFNGQSFHLVHFHTATVVAAAGVAFGVFVGQHTALRLQNSLGGHVFAGDQLNPILLAGQLCGNGGRNVRIRLGQRRMKKTVQIRVAHSGVPSKSNCRLATCLPGGRWWSLYTVLARSLPDHVPHCFL